MKGCEDSCAVLQDRDDLATMQKEDSYLLAALLSSIKLKIPFSKELLQKLEDRVGV